LNGACTIVSPNYLAYARTVSASYLAQHPGHRFFVLIVADLSLADRKLFEDDEFTPVMLVEIGLKDLRGEAMKYDILELNTNVKPTFMKYLIRTFDLENLIYLDPDIFVYSPLTPVFQALSGGANAVLTPHITMPILDDKLPSEQDHLYNGTYNLGFIGIRRSEGADRILSWWERHCLDSGFSEGRTGLFVDQKWMNLAPGLFERVSILRHVGCNMAYWNLQERWLEQKCRESTGVDRGYSVRSASGETTELCFFHFSGIVVDAPEILSKNTNRFTLADRPDLIEMFVEYKAAVIANRDVERQELAYGFDRLSDGTVITRLARRIYAEHQMRWVDQDPFNAAGGFARFAKRLGLLAGKTAPKKSTWREFNPKDRRVQLVHNLLKLMLRVLGPNRYELLMRYLAHIAVLRNQSVFLKD
jgi:hypothetical protein